LRRRRAAAFARLSSTTLRAHPALMREPKRAAKPSASDSWQSDKDKDAKRQGCQATAGSLTRTQDAPTNPS
jgi:hypothetical protein